MTTLRRGSQELDEVLAERGGASAAGRRQGTPFGRARPVLQPAGQQITTAPK